MVNTDIEAIEFVDLTQLKIPGYKLDENIAYITETVSYVCENNEDCWIEFTMVPEYDALGFDTNKQGVIMSYSEACQERWVIHFPAEVSWNAVQAFIDKKFGKKEVTVDE
jgi:hypothetical protein